MDFDFLLRPKNKRTGSNLQNGENFNVKSLQGKQRSSSQGSGEK
jgi:hypothetical protein